MDEEIKTCLTFRNDSFFSLSRNCDGLKATGHVDAEELRKFVEQNYSEIKKILEKMREDELNFVR